MNNLKRKDLKRIAKELVNIKVTFRKSSYTEFDTNNEFININVKELDCIPINEKIKRNQNVNEFYLIALLHEIAHYKRGLKFPNGNCFFWHYRTNYEKEEKIADRYSRYCYKKVLKAYKKKFLK